MAQSDKLDVLLVASDDATRSFIEQILLSLIAGANQPALSSAASGTGAIARAREGSVDLVIVDSRIGGEDGLELVRQLRGAFGETPILALTDTSGEDVAAESLRAGATDYLCKSIRADEARRSLRYALDLSNQARLRRRAEDALRLREEQLRETQRLETLATLSGGVAHEFNNLLNIVVGYGDMLRRRLPAEEPLQRYIEHILQAAGKASALTRQLQAFSRTQDLEPAVHAADGVVAELAPVIRSLLGRRTELSLLADPGAGRIKADRSQIELALMNLVVNAKEAMPEGGSLAIEARSVFVEEPAADGRATPGRYVMLAVTDSGAGMTPAVLARAFEPFFTTKGRGGATGLGLSTVHGILRQSGGFVRTTSEPGRGTCVELYLPLVDAAGLPVGLPAPGTQEPLEVLLVVDDEVAVRAVLVDSLRDAGYRVLEAASGTGALEIAAVTTGPIHLLLTDVLMPGMSGPELAARLSELRQGIRIVYTSGATKQALAQRETAEDAPFLWKPFTAELLRRTVRQALDAER